MQINRARRVLAAAGVAALALTMGALPSTAEIVGDFQAGADADLLEVSGVALPPGCGDEGIPILGELIACDFELAQLVLGDTETAVDSNSGLSYTGDDGLSAYGHGSNIDPDLLNAGGLEGAITAEMIQEATAKAPIGPASDDPDPISVPADPLLHVNLATVSADALDVGAGNNTCPVSGEDRLNLSNGYSELAGLAVGPDALGEGMDLVGVEDPEGVSFAQSSVDAVDSLVPGPNWGIESTARVRMAPLSLLGGTIDVQVTDPVLTVSNDGTGPEVSYTPSIVTINGDTVVDGETIEFLDALDLPEPLAVTVDIANQEDVVIDGTTVTVADAVRISVVLAGELEVLTLTLGNLSAAAEVPEGGISFQNCDGENPLRELHKTASAAEVEPGQEFDYTITVPNRDETCTLTDVTVVDEVTGPDGFEIISASNGGTIDGNTVTWNLDDIAPNETVTLQIRVRAPDDAEDGEEFTDSVAVTATCDGEEFENDVMIVMPVVNIPGTVPEGCFVGDSNKTATHEEVKPGQTFNWLVNVFNTGSEACTDIVVTDTMPDGFEFVDCQPTPCDESDGVVTFTIDELDRGASVTLTITAAAPQELGEYENVAVIAPGNGDPTTVSTTHPEVTDESIPLPPDPPTRGDFSPTQMPRTGGGAALIGLGLLGGLAMLRRRTA